MRVFWCVGVTLVAIACRCYGQSEPPSSAYLGPPEAVEVVASTASFASAYLGDRSFVPLSGLPEAKRYAGEQFYCSTRSHLYLVKAYYAHAMTGGFAIQRRGSTLYIEHSSLGHSSPKNQTAFVVCSDAEIDGAISSFGVAE